MSKKLVIIVNGKPRAGKDTVVALLKTQFAIRGWATEEFSSIRPVYDMLMAAGINVHLKRPEDRDLLSVVGDAIEKHSHTRTNISFGRIRRAMASLSSEGVVFFLHMREPDLIESLRVRLLKEDITTQVILVTGRGLDITSNASDSGTDKTDCDITISNSGTLLDLSKSLAVYVEYLLMGL